jgi:thymidine kinase
MAVLRFSFGTMGSGKSTLALQVHHNLEQCGQVGLLLARLGRDDSHVTSRLGIRAPCLEVDDGLDLYELCAKYRAERGRLDYVVCDEAQFFSAAQADQLARVVDELRCDVFAYGLITDFRGLLFAGTSRLLELADERVSLQVEARCWCGARAANNARLVNGELVREGEVVAVGDTSPAPARPLFGDTVSYVLLCRRHFRDGRIRSEVES